MVCCVYVRVCGCLSVFSFHKKTKIKIPSSHFSPFLSDTKSTALKNTGEGDSGRESGSESESESEVGGGGGRKRTKNLPFVKCVVLQGGIGACKSSAVFGCASDASSSFSLSPFSSPSLSLNLSPSLPLSTSSPSSSLSLLPLHPPLVLPQTKKQFKIKEIHPGLLRLVGVSC